MKKINVERGMTTPRKPSDWICKYVKGYKEKKLSIEQILEAENAIRERCGTRRLKYNSVKRMLNHAGISTSKAETKEVKQAEMISSVAEIKPCLACEYHVRDKCVCPSDLFELYTTLDDFYKDLLKNRCELKKVKERSS